MQSFYSLTKTAYLQKLFPKNIYNVGNVDYTKENYKILENTLMPHYNVFIEYLMKPNAYFYWGKNKRARFSPQDENIDVTGEQENTPRNKVKFFMSFD